MQLRWFSLDTFAVYQDSGAKAANSRTSAEKIGHLVTGRRVINCPFCHLNYHRRSPPVSSVWSSVPCVARCARYIVSCSVCCYPPGLKLARTRLSRVSHLRAVLTNYNEKNWPIPHKNPLHASFFAVVTVDRWERHPDFFSLNMIKNCGIHKIDVRASAKWTSVFRISAPARHE